MNPSIRERPSWELTDQSPVYAVTDEPVMARFVMYMFAAGGTLALALVVLPHRSSMNELGVVTVAIAAYMVSLLLLVTFGRIPWRAHQVTMGIGTLFTTAGIYFLGEITGAVVVLYVMIAASAFYFLSRNQALLQCAWIGAAYGAVLLTQGSLTDAINPWVVTLGTLLTMGILMGYARERADWLMARLADAARTDPLTGLLNRRGFEEVFDLEIERARRSDSVMSLLIGDLDRFKQVNDRFGRHAGDEALERLSSVFSGKKRRIDTAARMGGEEFALVLPDTDEHGAYTLAERLRDEVRLVFEAEPVGLTISFGVASFPTHGETSESLLQAADHALYAAKALGRDRSVIHSLEIAGTVTLEGRREDCRDHLATVLALAETLDVRDSGTAHHSQTVGRYAELAATELRLPREVVERVRIAGVLHDVGKVGIPDSVLEKPGPLRHDEWDVMKKHPEIGARILEGSEFEDIRAWVLAHQERPDGRGYPRGLSGEEIPLGARIIAVADAYEAMTSDRVYRPALSDEAAQVELMQCTGTQFDKQVTEAFLRLLERRGSRVKVRAVA